VYPKQIPPAAQVVSYSPLYGSLPVGPAFDLAIAALMRAGGSIFPTPNGEGEGCPGTVVLQRQALAARPIACLKCSGEGEVGIITLAG
ncbi:MAG TPA: hypothetical protein DCF93_12175, partial [Desulfuromonas sp.]|nr:hypothetical protein [Desulfuromonas sp.]